MNPLIMLSSVCCDCSCQFSILACEFLETDNYLTYLVFVCLETVVIKRLLIKFSEYNS